jgi:hypothetical protein
MAGQEEWLMPSSDNQWISYLSAIMSTCIASMALWVASRQSKTNMAKLRLDLYDKRFAIYENTLAFHQALAGPSESMQTEAFKSLQRAFIKSYRESQFLFDEDSGVFQLLNRVNLDAFKIVAAKTHARELRGEHAVRMMADGNDAFAAIEKSMSELERAIGPYIRFNKTLI